MLPPPFPYRDTAADSVFFPGRAPGDAIDYSYGVADVRWSYSAELRDTGTVSRSEVSNASAKADENCVVWLLVARTPHPAYRERGYSRLAVPRKIHPHR